MMQLAPHGGAGRGQGRKPSDAPKRNQVAFSLYDDDIEKLDQLTGNRSEFLRQAISDAWQIRERGLVAVLMTPAQLDALHELAKSLPAKKA